jgi:hypothetical protein
MVLAVPGHVWRRFGGALVCLAEICRLLRVDVTPVSCALAIDLWNPTDSPRLRYLTSVGPAWAAPPSPQRLPTGSPLPSPVGRQRLQPRRLPDAVMRWHAGGGRLTMAILLLLDAVANWTMALMPPQPWLRR